MKKDLLFEVNRLLSEGFPMPDEKRLDFSNGPTESALSAALESAAHLAVNVNDKRHRDVMLTHVQASLLCGGDLSAAERAWLFYVLNKLDDIPCECKNGRPIDGNEEALFRMTLVAFVIDDEIKNPDRKRGYVTRRLKRASEALKKSYETVRKMYYAKSFNPLLKRMKERGFNPLQVK